MNPRNWSTGELTKLHFFVSWSLKRTHWFIDSTLHWLYSLRVRSFIGSLIHRQIIHALIHWFIVSLSHRFIVSLSHRVIGSLNHRCMDSLIHWFTDSLVHWFIDSLIHRFFAALIGWFIDIHWVIASLLHWFTYSLIHWFIDSLVHSFSCEWIFHVISLASQPPYSLVDAPQLQPLMVSASQKRSYRPLISYRHLLFSKLPPRCGPGI